MARPAVLAWLAEAQRRGFLGPADPASHVEHAERFVAAVGDDFRGLALDLGTGAGVPGLLLAERWPSSRWILLDGRDRRTGPLEAAVAELGLADRVEVRCERAELAGHGDLREALDLVVARSFGPPAVAAECGGAFLRRGGTLVVSEPPSGSASVAAADERWPVEPLAALGLAPVAPAPPGVQGLTKVAPTPADRPRRVGIPAKRPLF